MKNKILTNVITAQVVAVGGLNLPSGNMSNIQLGELFGVAKPDGCIEFLKTDASGNDFIVMVANQENIIAGTNIKLNSGRIIKICSRHKGVGCDQLLLIKGISQGGIIVEIYNQDGTQAANCGNGTRVIAGYFFLNNPKETECTVEIIYNSKITRRAKCRKLEDGLVEVEVGEIKTEIVNGEKVFNVGNLHKVIPLEHREMANAYQRQGTSGHWQEVYPNIEFPKADEMFNTNFIHILEEGKIGLTTVERGVGITNSCGSGSCAAVAYCVDNGMASPNKPVQVITKGSTESGKKVYVTISKLEKAGHFSAKMVGDYNINFFGLMKEKFVE